MLRYTTNIIAGALSLWLAAGQALAGNVTLIEENDWFYKGDDYDYTQGALLSYTTDPLVKESRWQAPFSFVGRYVPLFNDANGHRQIEWIVLGQNMYTPVNKRRANPDPNDRPYAGWLYTGAALMEDHNGESLDYAELLVGIVGPGAMANRAQDWAHKRIGGTDPQGWAYQLSNEPGVALSLEKKFRFHQPILPEYGLGVEAIPEGGVTLGNVWTYAQTGITLRAGQNLLANYGTKRVRPALSGTSYFNPDAMKNFLGWNIYGGLQGRAVAQNIFLDGNTFADSRSVDKKNFVGTAHAGVSVFLREGPSLDFGYVWCGKEFDTTRSCSHYGGANLGWNF